MAITMTAPFLHARVPVIDLIDWSVRATTFGLLDRRRAQLNAPGETVVELAQLYGGNNRDEAVAGTLKPQGDLGGDPQRARGIDRESGSPQRAHGGPMSRIGAELA